MLCDRSVNIPTSTRVKEASGGVTGELGVISFILTHIARAARLVCGATAIQMTLLPSGRRARSRAAVPNRNRRSLVVHRDQSGGIKRSGDVLRFSSESVTAVDKSRQRCAAPPGRVGKTANQNRHQILREQAVRFIREPPILQLKRESR